MRVAAITILLSVLLQACGFKGALVLPPEKASSGGQQSNKNKQHSAP